MSPSRTKVEQVCLQLVIKDSGSLSLGFLSCNASLYLCSCFWILLLHPMGIGEFESVVSWLLLLLLVICCSLFLIQEFCVFCQHP